MNSKSTNQIPENLFPINAVCNVNPRIIRNNSSEELNVSFIPMAAIDEEFGEIKKIEVKKFKDVSKGFTYFEENDVLFAKITPCMENGKIAIARNLENGIGFGSTEFHVLRCSEFIIPEYLFYFLRQKRLRKYAESFFTGSAGQQRVPNDFFKRAKIPLPPLSEQKQIVSILQEADALRREYKSILEKSNKLASALFLEMFGDPVRNEKGWDKTALESFTRATGGGTPSKAINSYWIGDIPWVSPKDMITNYIDNSEDHISESAIKETVVNLIPVNSILVVVRSGILKHTLPVAINVVPVTVNQDIKVFIPNKEINSIFLLYHFKSISRYILEKVRMGATVHNIETNSLKKILFIQPPIDLQNTFAEKVQAIEETTQAIEKSLRKIETLYDSLLQQAFNGGLTEKWRERNPEIKESNIKRKKIQVQAFSNDLEEDRQMPEEITKKKSISPLKNGHRMWIKKQLSEEQEFLLHKFWRWGGFIHSENIDTFIGEVLYKNEFWSGEEGKARTFRILNQLTGIGLVEKATLQTNEFNFVTVYRLLEEDDRNRTKESDIEKIRYPL